jgi:uncharacterized protein (DUF1697 family)
MTEHIALLRGINVGGHHKLPMQALRRIFADAGATDVQTYIQSGNVVFAGKAPAKITARAKTQITEEFGFDIPIVHRSAAQWSLVQAGWPFDISEADPKFLAVGFLAETPSATKVASLDPERSPPDTYVVRDAHIYLHYPEGVARSKLTNAWFDRQLGTTSTMRNWKTVQKLLEMVGGPSAAGEPQRPAPK